MKWPQAVAGHCCVLLEESCPSVSSCGQSPFIPDKLSVATDTRTHCQLCWAGTHLHLRDNGISAPPFHSMNGLLVSPDLCRKPESWPFFGLGCLELKVFQYKVCTALDGAEARAVSQFSTFKLAVCSYTHFCSMCLEYLNVCHIPLLPQLCHLIINTSSTAHAILQTSWWVAQWGHLLSGLAVWKS